MKSGGGNLSKTSLSLNLWWLLVGEAPMKLKLIYLLFGKYPNPTALIL